MLTRTLSSLPVGPPVSQGWSALLSGGASRLGEGPDAGPPRFAASLWPTQFLTPEAGSRWALPTLGEGGTLLRWSICSAVAWLKGPCRTSPPGARLGGVVRRPFQGVCPTIGVVHKMNRTLCEQGGDPGRGPRVALRLRQDRPPSHLPGSKANVTLRAL